MPGPCPEDGDETDPSCSHGARDQEPPRPAYRLSWTRLLARVFRIDVTICPACGGKMKVIALLPVGQALTDPHAIRSYLDGVGLESRPPPVVPARPLPQTEFEYAG